MDMTFDQLMSLIPVIAGSGSLMLSLLIFYRPITVIDNQFYKSLLTILMLIFMVVFYPSLHSMTYHTLHLIVPKDIITECVYLNREDCTDSKRCSWKSNENFPYKYILKGECNLNSRD